VAYLIVIFSSFEILNIIIKKLECLQIHKFLRFKMIRSWSFETIRTSNFLQQFWTLKNGVIDLNRLPGFDDVAYRNPDLRPIFVFFLDSKKIHSFNGIDITGGQSDGHKTKMRLYREIDNISRQWPRLEEKTKSWKIMISNINAAFLTRSKLLYKIFCRNLCLRGLLYGSGYNHRLWVIIYDRLWHSPRVRISSTFSVLRPIDFTST